MTLEQPPVRHDGLQIDEHRPFQETFWKAERIAWVGFGFFLLLAVFGVTGSGGLHARMEFGFDDGFVEVPRFSRWEMSDRLNALLPPGSGNHRLAIGSEFFRTFQVEDIDPPPVSSMGSSNETVYHFRSEAQQPLALTMHLRAQGPGIVNYHVSVNGKPAQTAQTIVWP
ncbi:hypothetical protein [Ensifer sp. LCM 4579]|uniref:hypothetical protein n=1 Tax=Ensifer sp. LCM 4579 TaxID=1848292 RepID=UPI001FCD1856|nr:hypothetical protein [Ensifer sp. LCM 4579]